MPQSLLEILECKLFEGIDLEYFVENYIPSTKYNAWNTAGVP